MRVVCHLRRLRGERKMLDLARAANVNVGDLSRIERGIMLPADHVIPDLERAYGVPREEWYASGTVAIVSDAEVSL
jgi:transcriptional regulator with XRE-family HTH domain